MGNRVNKGSFKSSISHDKLNSAKRQPPRDGSELTIAKELLNIKSITLAPGIDQLRVYKQLEQNYQTSLVLRFPLTGCLRTMLYGEPCSAWSEPFRWESCQSSSVQSGRTHQDEHSTVRVRCLLSCSIDAYLAGLSHGIVSQARWETPWRKNESWNYIPPNGAANTKASMRLDARMSIAAVSQTTLSIKVL